MNSPPSPDDSEQGELVSRPTSVSAGTNSIGPNPPGRPNLVALRQAHLRRPRVWLPVTLFLLTCVSTFLAGSMSWEPYRLPGLLTESSMIARQVILRHASQGMAFMVYVIAILFAHEMGHYLMTRLYRIPSSLPYFIPFPIAPWGTMGAVIAMRGQLANRKEIFDIGIAGPLAGLVFAIPITWHGISTLDMNQAAGGTYLYDLPLLARWIYGFVHPASPALSAIHASQMNAAFMAGWVGLLITGLNMLPVSQLDGGHVTYTLFGVHSRWMAKAFLATAVAYMIWSKVFVWTLMLVLILVIGLHHPRTADDTVPLGWPRVLLGLASLLIPIFCFAPRGPMPIFP